MAVAAPQTRSSRRRLLALACALVAVIAATGFWLVHRRPAGSDSSRPIALLISGDTAGWIVPCGCTSNQSGGLLRRGTYVKDAGQQAEVILADAGGAPAGTSPYHRVKFEAILKGEQAMGLAAHNLGGPEAALGADYLRRLATREQVPFLSANARDEQGQPIAEAVRIIERGGRRVALVGVLSRRFAGAGLQVDDPREAILKAVAGVKGHYDALVVLAYLPEEELGQLAAGLPEADAVVGGPTGQSIAPRAVGPTLLASATNKGKYVIHLEAAAGGGKLAWTGQVVEMAGNLADDPDQKANRQTYLAELGRRDFVAAETGLAAALPAGLPQDYRISGNASCLKCHQADCAHWDGTKHAHAWQTLSERGSQVDSYCQQCHTTGFALPGGFESMARSPLTRSVGCESCHGPSQAHVLRPETRTPFAARDQCVRCHDHENSPLFQYVSYWERIQHGVKVNAARPRQSKEELP